jgi:hypothetical protein
MEFTYNKLDNTNLYNIAISPEFLNLDSPQNFVPIYSRFFSLNEKNFNKVTLNNKYNLDSINEMTDHNSCKAKIIDISGNLKTKDVFFKYSPLLDPTKYLIGRYDLSDNNLLGLPSLINKTCHAKTADPNNSAYVDGFFNYLSSQMLNTHNFPHGLDFFGSFLAKKHDFQYNIADDVEYLNNSEFFHEKRGILFDIDNTHANDMFNFDTRQNKERILITNKSDENEYLDLSDISDLKQLDNLFTNGSNTTDTIDINKDVDLVFSYDISANSNLENDSSDCSSRSSDTDNDIDEDDDIDEDEDDDSDNSDSYSTATEDVLLATIKDFPVQVIALEKCFSTLDSLIIDSEYDISDKEWGCIMIQIIMTLLAYNKSFGFTHNDLHTNNIMYVQTEKKHLYYRFGEKHYKVPTFGRLYKIIDFGRAVYKFRGNVVCSDSYHPKGDAASQYNFEPYFDSKKPRLDPNFSFDLCRLSCSIYDFIIDEVEQEDINSSKTEARRMILGWCIDDKNRNILYKQNHEERYQDFKLYKMIARTVHNHTPDSVIKSEYFNRYLISKNKINTKTNIINIDSLPSYQ